MFYCPVQVEVSPSLQFPNDVLLSSTGGGQYNSPVSLWCFFFYLYRWRPVQFSCFRIMFYYPVQVEVSPSLQFPHDVLLSCTGGGQSQPPVSSWCFTVLYRWRSVPTSSFLMMFYFPLQVEASTILLFPYDVFFYLYRWRPVQYSCFLMLFYCEIAFVNLRLVITLNKHWWNRFKTTKNP